jgi:DNA polymerase III delta subunit
MSNLPNPILIFGDYYTSRNQIKKVKKKYVNYDWVSLSLTDLSMDEIVSEMGTEDLFGGEKAFVLYDIPNNKETRSFLLDLISRYNDTVIIWDSLNHIKKDDKTHKILKTWEPFVQNIESMTTSLVKNNGDPYTEKSIADCVDYIKRQFKAYGKNIEIREANMLIRISGYDRGTLSSEIKKLSLFQEEEYISMETIINNAYPVTQEAILYKFSNALDTGSYAKMSSAIEEFLSVGINGNVLAEIMLKKIRWHLITVSYHLNGISWNEMSSKLMEAGDFQYKDYDEVMNFLTNEKGLPARFFNIKKPKVKLLKSGKPSKVQPKLELKKSEKLPMRFIADQTVSIVKSKILNGRDEQDVLEKLEKAYCGIYDLLVDVRLNKNVHQSLNEMAKIVSVLVKSG